MYWKYANKIAPMVYMLQTCNNTVNKIAEIVTCSKFTANASESCKQNEINDVYADSTRYDYVVETDAITSKY